MELKYVILHTPLFLAGANLSDKLDIRKRSGLSMDYDKKDGDLKVYYQPPNHEKEMAIVPLSNVAAMIPADPVRETQVKKPEAKGPIKAQVSTPTSHVFEGEGKGQTGLDEARKAII